MEKSTDEEKKATSKDKLTARKKLIIVVLVLLLVGAAVAYFTLRTESSTIQIKKDAESAEVKPTVPIYFPVRTPQGYTYKQGSLSSTDGVALYYLESNDSRRIIFSIQAKPAGFNFDKFNQSNLTNTKDIDIPSGKAVVGVLGVKAVGSVETEKVWILVSAPLNIPDEDLTLMISSLNEVKIR